MFNLSRRYTMKKLITALMFTSVHAADQQETPQFDSASTAQEEVPVSSGLSPEAQQQMDALLAQFRPQLQAIIENDTQGLRQEIIDEEAAQVDEKAENTTSKKRQDLETKIQKDVKAALHRLLDHINDTYPMIERETKRILDQVINSIDAAIKEKKIERETKRIANQVEAEYNRTAPRVEAEGKRVLKKLGLRKKK